MFENMTLREKVYQTFITYPYHMAKEGTIKKFFQKHPCGGIYYSKGSCTDLAKEMESGAIAPNAFIAECRAASKHPLIVCADGASIENGRECPPFTSIAATRDMQLAYDTGKALGMQMNYNHIDWILAPCVDMPLVRVNSTISYAATDDPELNAEMYHAMVRGIQDQGIAATAKHFPGQGLYHVNFHYGPGRNTQTLKEWEETYGRTYRACFDADCMCVMTSHITFRAWSEKGDDGRWPIATYSTDITVKLLKEHLGFRGAVVTDALTMGGMAGGDQTEEAVQAFKSGADFLLWPPMEAADRIVEEIEKGNIPMARLEDALSRIEYVRTFLKYKGAEREYNAADPAFVNGVHDKAIGEGMALIRNKIGLVPFSPEKHKRILVAGCGRNDSEMNQLRQMVPALEKRGFTVDFREYLLTCWQDEMNALQSKYDLVIVCYNIPFTAVDCYDKCASTTWSAHLLDKSKSLFVNFTAPHFADDFFPEAKTFINTNTGNASNLAVEEVVARLVGEKPFTGTSPVKLDC